jgi:hypothetical protein
MEYIVKQSKKTNDDIVADMNLKELRMLEIGYSRENV